MHVTSSVNNCNEHLNIIDTLTHQHYEEGCPFKNTIFTNILSHFKNTCTFALNKPATLKSSHTLSKKKCKNRPHRTHTQAHTHTHTHTHTASTTTHPQSLYCQKREYIIIVRP